MHETNEAQAWPNFPADAIAFASEGTADRLIIRANSDEFFYWDHEDGAISPVDIDFS